MDFQVAIIGAGVVGLAIGRELSASGMDVMLIEKNERYGMEMSSRNSEVIHAGIYYPPDSLKSKLCILGKHLLYQYLERRSLPHSRCGKIIVASDKADMDRLSSIAQNAMKAGVDDLKLIDHKELNSLEPNISGVAGIFSPSSGIIDVHAFMDSLVGELRQENGEIVVNSEVIAIEKIDGGYQLTVRQDEEDESFTCKWVINSAGLFADKIALMAGLDIEGLNYKLHWCKGNYFRLTQRAGYELNHLVYPVPQKNLSGLGVHTTLDLAGGIKFGPDVNYLDVKKENYDVDDKRRNEFISSIHSYMPQISETDLSPDMAGLRAKLQGPGDDFMDFVIKHETEKGLPGMISLIGIESPGLTAALAIGIHVSNIIQGN